MMLPKMKGLDIKLTCIIYYQKGARHPLLHLRKQIKHGGHNEYDAI